MYKIKPLKIKLKRLYEDTGDDEMEIPLKKRIIENSEKENNGEMRNSPNKNSFKILENSPPIKRTPKTRKNVLDEDGDEDDNNDDDVISEVFLELQKSGKKIGFKTPPRKNSVNSKNNSSAKSVSESRTGSEKKSRRGLLKEFDDLSNSPKEKNKSIVEKKVPELEKCPEDLILNHKRVSKKIFDLRINESPKKKDGVVIPLRRSDRLRSSILSEPEIVELEKTPSRRGSKDGGEEKTPICKTPQHRTSSAKKSEPEVRTPTSKIVERQPTTPLEKARVSLHLSVIPECLPCREEEFDNIRTFVENKLWDETGGCMYISGVPGTGKTATVTQVIRHLKNASKMGDVPEFKFVELNGMRLSDPRQAYVQLWQKLFDKKEKITSDRAQRLLDNWFSKGGKTNCRKTTILLVDELDLICTKKQDVVYNLLDWPTRTYSRLVVLTIANTMDMPERLFKGRITSRMGLTRLTFMPYTHKQLEEIVLARLTGLDAFVTDAVRLVSRKVAAVSGDARRALDICRRATELPLPDETVKISHIEQAIKEMTNSNIVKVIRNCGEMEKLFLRSLSDVSSRSNAEEVDLCSVIDQLLAVCVLEGIPRPSITSVLSVSNRLKCCRLIFSNQSAGGILQRLVLNVTQDDIHYALRT